MNFNPRIPLGMRRIRADSDNLLDADFNPRIPLGMRRKKHGRRKDIYANFNPRIPLGMRLYIIKTYSNLETFQSTHPIRDATF